MFDYKDLLRYFISEFENFNFRVEGNTVFLKIEQGSSFLEKSETMEYLEKNSKLTSLPFNYIIHTTREKTSYYVLGISNLKHSLAGKRNSSLTIIFNEQISQQMILDGFHR